MSWASEAIHALTFLGGGIDRFVTVRPFGHSMKPLVKSGATVVLRPVLFACDVSVGDIVLVTVNGRDYLHLVKELSNDGKFLIGNNRGGINGWVGIRAIHGKATMIDGKAVSCSTTPT